jgi:hypothetical protein
MKYAKKIVCCIALINGIALPYPDNKTNKNYIQRRNQKTQEKKEGTAAIRKKRNHRPWLRNRPPAKHRLTQTLGELLEDAARINIGLFSWDSLKIFATTAPFFVGARMVD